MVTGATGDDMNALGLIQRVVGKRSKRCVENPAVSNAPIEGARNSIRLLVDFLEHVVAKLATFRRICVER